MDKLLSNKLYEKKKDVKKENVNTKKELFNPFKNCTDDELKDNINDDEYDVEMCKLVLRKLIKDFTYERVLDTIPKKYKYLNSLLERPIDSLCKQYKIETINKAMEELKKEMDENKENKKE